MNVGSECQVVLTGKCHTLRFALSKFRQTPVGRVSLFSFPVKGKKVVISGAVGHKLVNCVK